MVKVVIVNGAPESGKTTFQEICRGKLADKGYTTIIKSSVDWVKDIAKYCGWDGTKTESNRRFLSDLKKALTNWDDAVLRDLVNEVDNFYYTRVNCLFFIDIREPEEIDKAKRVFNASTLLVKRPSKDNLVHQNDSDNNVFNYEYDYYIHNDKEISWLHEYALAFVQELLEKEDNIYMP